MLYVAATLGRKLTEEEIKSKNSSIKVRDHCHRDLTDKISVIFNHLRGYDSHFIMQEIGKFKQDIDVIPKNIENIWHLYLENI